jgi:hypothetical protein
MEEFPFALMVQATGMILPDRPVESSFGGEEGDNRADAPLWYGFDVKLVNSQRLLRPQKGMEGWKKITATFLQ